MDEIEARVAELERRLAALEGTAASAEGPATATATPPAPHDTASPDPLDDAFWALKGLKSRISSPGAVMYLGAVELAAGPVEWQMGVPTDAIMDRDWTAQAGALAALGHPVRLAILQAVAGGAETTAELTEAAGLGSTGQLYHHLSQLQAQGWLVPSARGRTRIPAERLVPLLAILAASA
ncbi:ArsR/SmtB family transcription factor [Homoserinibacter sp. YIM 151385]|uniref:ArsR/SmtB family transcription factor n=1 Tax=Homoserinibacter sp. YIM 151385 TaxID=2985506 RepID=UPI0022F0EF8C|nr:winged helix-turn-helix domain-containing protein [Homoserinibacter sp. YIM 151385]WBU39129.1 winged helix-turn-helix domain-containing protein [Homoserinibacter sp. YIM 151385]